jgi:copper(I)-binding protein
MISGCAGSASDEPNTAGDATAVPGNIPGIGTSGSITVSGVSIHRTGDQLAITARIRNGGSAPDQLLSISSQVSTTLTESPALTIPAKSTTQLGADGTKTTLAINARLEPGGSIALTLDFRGAGQIDAYSSFS